MDLATVDDYTRTVGPDTEDTFKIALEKVGSSTKPSGTDGQYLSNCPGPSHRNGDRNPSLHWQQTSNGRLVFHCFGGCEYEDILKSLGLRGYQLYPVRQEFDYFDAEGTYRFTVRRTNTADESKRIVQVRRNEDGTEDDGNGLEPGEGILWLEPELEVAAEDARAAGRKLTLWMPEGEKDVRAVAASGSLGEHEFATTNPGGARGWNGALTERLRGLWDRGVLGSVVVVCDSDNAGVARGVDIRDALATIEDLPVRVLVVGDGVDLADLCDRDGARWVESLSELNENEIADALEEGSPVTNYMLRAPLETGAAAGRRGMAIRSKNKEGEDRIDTVLIGEVIPIERWDGGYTVEVRGPKFKPTEITITNRDMTSRAAFDRWLAEAGLAMAPRSGYGTDTVAASLRMWLDWYARTHGVRTVVTTEYLTWVDPVTGEPATTYDPHHPAVFVTPDDTAEESHGVRWVGTEGGDCRWLKEREELDAAWALARALTFADERTVVSVVGWAAAMALAPWLGRHLDTKPGLAIIAPSGGGKTHGAARQILQLFGCAGQSTSSVAAFRRRLAQGGVSAIQWIDDSAMIDDVKFKEMLRVTTSGTTHSLANPDAGTRATDSARLTGCVVISAEGVAWAGETAMQDRFLFVRPEAPAGRMSLRKGGEKDFQLVDLQDLNAEWGRELWRGARWVIDGLTSSGAVGRIDGWAAQVGVPKGRGDVPAFAAAMGARAVATWLYGVKAAAGDAWPGKTEEWSHPKYNGWKWLIDTADSALVEARDTRRWNVLISDVIPAVLRAHLGTVSGKGLGNLVVENIDAGDENQLRNSVYRAVGIGTDLVTAMPIVLIDTEERIWVWTAQLSSWYENRFRQRAEARVTSAKALADQLSVAEDNPPWAVWSETKGAGRKYERPGVRVGRRDMGKNRAIYRRLSREASAAVLNGE